MELTNSSKVFMHFQAMSNELVTPKVLVCNLDTPRRKALNFLNDSTNSFNSNSNLSYFVALDAAEGKPERLLGGDRNITGGVLAGGFLRLLNTNTAAGWTSLVHSNAGNIGLADGSSMQTTPAILQQQLQKNTLDVIRLAIP